MCETSLLFKQFVIIVNAHVSFCWNSSLLLGHVIGKWLGLIGGEKGSISNPLTIINKFSELEVDFMWYFQTWI
jgi:hypothetical protein